MIVSDRLVVNRASLRQLAAAEAAWLVRQRLLWVGAVAAAAAAYLLSRGEPSTQSESYTLASMVVLPWAIVTFVLAARSASRDEPASDQAFSPVVPLGHPDRMVGRAIGLALPVGVAAVLAVVVGTGSRIEGGYWLGDAPFRTDTAQHTWLELGQMPLVTFLLGGAGLALGRFVRPKAFGAVTGLGVAVLVVGSIGWWLWNQPPIHAAALHQTQPLYVRIADSLGRPQFDSDWLMSWDFHDEPGWYRMIVHRPTIIAHHLYLTAVGVALCAAAVWTRSSRRIAIAAVVVAIAVVGTQIAIYPEVTSR